ncbi:hypothetical protein EHO57_14160 [Leptospira langatensis]|uniref:Uncharacterized protein n=1 Tax=Leptospira langatensis TaxID=2484983 RepID=A0A5R2ASW1_9LEPT|nr:hypothetical protein [Leptospira langatensis]TGJ99898.1 hypothetical protein EHO57_14160 [Leptospira langatensis]
MEKETQPQVSTKGTDNELGEEYLEYNKGRVKQNSSSIDKTVDALKRTSADLESLTREQEVLAAIKWDPYKSSLNKITHIYSIFEGRGTHRIRSNSNDRLNPTDEREFWSLYEAGGYFINRQPFEQMRQWVMACLRIWKWISEKDPVNLNGMLPVWFEVGLPIQDFPERRIGIYKISRESVGHSTSPFRFSCFERAAECIDEVGFEIWLRALADPKFALPPDV